MPQIELKPFLDLMRRATKCKFKSVFMVNHLLIQCYTVDIDSDIGFHYICPIPKNNPAYEDSFYDCLVELRPSDILKTYNVGHKILLNFKKENKLKPKDVYEEMYVQRKEDALEIKFLFYQQEHLLTTHSYLTPYPIDQTEPTAENCVKTLEAMADRIKPGGSCVILDGLRLGLLQRTLESVQIYHHVIKINGTKVRLPLAKSMFLGNKQFDQFLITVQETVMDDIYLYTIALTRKGITECFVGYLQNY